MHTLHSFPTRRSSDLMTCTFTVNVTGNAGTIHDNRVDGVVTDDDATTATDFDTETVTILNVLPTVDVTKTAKDRKSTRLNSSHLVISYAVFCLQKKHM